MVFTKIYTITLSSEIHLSLFYHQKKIWKNFLTPAYAGGFKFGNMNLPRADEFWKIYRQPGVENIRHCCLAQSIVDQLPPEAEVLLATAFNIRAQISNGIGSQQKLKSQLESLNSQFSVLCEGQLDIKAIFASEPK